MSQYLAIWKDDVQMAEWSRNSDIYKVMHGASYDEEEFNPDETFSFARDAMDRNVRRAEKEKKAYLEALSVAKLDYEAFSDVPYELRNFDDEIELYKMQLAQIDFLIQCAELDLYDERRAKWTWQIV